MYRASVENRGDSKFHATTRDYSFVMDTEGKGANPVDALLASLSACLGHQVNDFMREQQITSHGFTIAAEAGLSKDKASLSEIEVFIDMKDSKLQENQRGDLVKYVERCNVHNTLKAGCHIQIHLK